MSHSEETVKVTIQMHLIMQSQQRGPSWSGGRQPVARRPLVVREVRRLATAAREKT